MLRPRNNLRVGSQYWYAGALVLLLFNVSVLSAQDILSGKEAYPVIQQADQAYDDKNFKEAHQLYIQAINHPAILSNCDIYIDALCQIIRIAGKEELGSSFPRDSLDPWIERGFKCISEYTHLYADLYQTLYATFKKPEDLERLDAVTEVNYQDTIQHIIQLKELAHFYSGLEQDHKVISPIQQAISLHQSSHGPDSLLGELYFDLGSSMRNLGHTGKAQNYLLEAKNLFERSNTKQHRNKVNLLNNLGNTYFDLQEYATAKFQYQDAISLWKEYEFEKEYSFLQFHLNLASTYQYLGKIDSAKILFDISKDIADELNSIPFSYYSQYGAFLLELNDHRRAQELFSLVVSENEIDNSYTSYTALHLLAKSQLGLGKYHEAFQSINRAIFLVDSLVNVDDPLRIDWKPNYRHHNILDMMQTRIDIMIKLQEKQEDAEFLSQIFDNYRSLFKGLETVRTGPYIDMTKLLLARHVKSSMSKAIDFTRKLYGTIADEAIHNFIFHAMEKSRNAELFERIQQTQSLTEKLIPDSLHLEEASLKYKIQSIYYAQSVANSEKERIDLHSDVLDLLEAYDEFKERVNREYPAYYQGLYSSESSLKDIQSNLKNTEQILEYFWTDTLVTILSIEKNQSEVIYCSLSDKLKEDIKWTSENLSAFSNTNNYQEYAGHTFSIYSQLIKPVLNPETSLLTVSPEGPISYIPLQALVSDTTLANFRTAPYLLYDVDVRYTYNIIPRNTQQNEEIESDPRILALAFSKSEKTQSSHRGIISELPNTEEEVRAIANIFPRKNVTFLIDDEASKQTLLDEVHKFNMLHLAVHGIADTSNTLSSRLLFKNPSVPDSLDQLHAFEMYGLDLNNIELAVLSACQSGIGKEIKGEGIFSVGRAFSYAGAKRIIMSLWNVDDGSTADIMQSFYREIAETSGTVEALRKSKISYINNTVDRFEAHPYYWAALTLTGDSKAVFKSPVRKSNNIIWWVLLAILAGLFTFYFLKKRTNPTA